MVEKPEDLVGKWFSNFFGTPIEYTFILRVAPSSIDPTFFHAYYINIYRTSFEHADMSIRMEKLEHETPLSYQRNPELQKINQKAIKYIFEKGFKK